jgi:hypothetical protein
MVLDSTGTLFIGDSLNANMTQGLTINQGTATNEAFALKFIGSDSGFSHPATALAEADTYFYAKPASGTAGGVALFGFTDTGSVGMQYRSFGVADNTDKTTSALGYHEFWSGKSVGGSWTNPGANANLVVFREAGANTRFIFDVEGSAHADVEWVAFADHDDLAVISGLEAAMLDQVPEEKRLMYEETGIIGRDSWHVENGKLRAMVNTNKLSMLHHGALMQIGERLEAIEERLLAAGA